MCLLRRGWCGCGVVVVVLWCSALLCSAALCCVVLARMIRGPSFFFAFGLVLFVCD